jgi:hypothetical protein
MGFVMDSFDYSSERAKLLFASSPSHSASSHFPYFPFAAYKSLRIEKRKERKCFVELKAAAATAPNKKKNKLFSFCAEVFSITLFETFCRQSGRAARLPSHFFSLQIDGNLRFAL